jgi:hypothetical protein
MSTAVDPSQKGAPPTRRALLTARLRYNNCFIVHSLSLTSALYVSTVSDRFA